MEDYEDLHETRESLLEPIVRLCPVGDRECRHFNVENEDEWYCGHPSIDDEDYDEPTVCPMDTEDDDEVEDEDDDPDEDVED